MPTAVTASSSTTDHTNADRTGQFLTRFGITWLSLGILAAIVFLAFPELDLRFSGAFYDSARGFPGRSQGWVWSVREAFKFFFWLCIAASLVGLVMTRDRTRTWLRLTFVQWLFMAMCMAAGPGSNVILKDHWGRARPKEIVEFGGDRTFTPPFIPANQCVKNCSFTSGEAASVFVPFYAAGLLVPHGSAALILAGTLLGFAAGLMRIVQGAHFLSDVVFAGIFMGLSVVLLHRLVFRQVPFKWPLGALAGSP